MVFSRLPIPGHPYLTIPRGFTAYKALPMPSTCTSPSPRQHIRWLSQRRWLLGESLPVPYAVDTSSALRTARGSSVPPLRLALHEGPHTSPGVGGGSGSGGELPSPSPCLVAQADNPRRLGPRHGDADMGSSACPYAALLDGMPDRMPGDRLFSPLVGLMISRSPRGYAVTSTPEGQALHLHRDEVVEDRLISAPYPPLSL